ncbi:MAG: hypothetical protein Q9M32_02555 [Sulfurimonas sp.]|nr:hypothetical protein [Sulfurimonas sp.]MDQ7061156.1 hypothetical protein [Sulfurimonas sp.]
MDEKKHDEIMSGIMKLLEDDKLNLADGITIWHSFGTFLFSNIDEEHKNSNKIYSSMLAYLEDMKNAKSTQK